jgi:4-amino-4-deoxy-L-arabinose transferase-like glycosyltransferase
MFRNLHRRAGHYAVLLLVTAGLCLPNLGGPSLWDIDEGNNATCAWEMLEADNWIVPTFNGLLRVDKPALLYWLQIGGYRLFGVGELGARLPSALASAVAVLATYELGRRMFSKRSGLLAGLVLAASPAFCAAGHFANPDALLCACTALTLLAFWQGFAGRSGFWFVPMGAGMGLAVLAKGPVGLVLPMAVGGFFLLWSRQLRRLASVWLLLGTLAFILVAGPWYVMVGVETKAEFLSGFLGHHNFGRFVRPLENHRGPFWYYGVPLLLGFLPWSVFLGPTVWYGLKELWASVVRSLRERNAPLGERADDTGPALRFLWCWIAVYLVFFTLAATKLPNYILPLYPPLAILTARFLDRWRGSAIQPYRGIMPVCLGGLALIGTGTSAAVLMAPRLLDTAVPGLALWTALGLVPVLGAAVAGWWLRRQRRGAVVAVVAATAVLFVGALAARGPQVMEAQKAPRPLAEALRTAETEPEIRVACYQYFQPSLVFYCRRQVDQLDDCAQVVDFLCLPLPAYLVVPAPVWENELRGKVPGPCRLVGRQRDFYRRCDVVVVTNR